MEDASFYDPLPPRQVASRMENAGVAKARMSTPQTIALAMMAGMFIALGAMFYTVVMTGAGDGYGPARWLGGIAFSLGFTIVVVTGAELFTGNNLIVMACANGRVSVAGLLRNWTLVYFGNMAGATLVLMLALTAGFLSSGDSAVGVTALKVAVHKTGLNFSEAFYLGVLCNILVCMATWMCYVTRSITDRILVIILPISGFVALGFEHSIANMFMIPLGIFGALNPGLVAGGSFTAAEMTQLNWSSYAHNLVAVTLGNLLGGGGLIGFAYFFIYLRNGSDDCEQPAAAEHQKTKSL